MFEHQYPEVLLILPLAAKCIRAEYGQANERDSDRMKMCERWRAAGATPAQRERYYLRELQRLNGELLV